MVSPSPLDPDALAGGRPGADALRSPFARSVGACAASLTVGLLICLATYLLRAVDFAPLRSLIALEDRIYTDFRPPALSLKRGFHPVMFVDIDDVALQRWGSVRDAAGGTPRALLAQIVHALRQAEPAAIFLDYDFRNHLPGDTALRAELERGPGLPPVLFPKFLGQGALPPCESQTVQNAPIEQDTVLDDTLASGSVGSVHSIVALGAYALIEGTCSFYWTRGGETGELVARPAAMLRAVELAQLPAGAGSMDFERTAPRMIPNRWWIRNDTGLLRDPNGQLAYARIKASLHLRAHAVELGERDLSALRNAIVIVSSTHSWSDDAHATPIGNVPGALVYANLALELQSPPARELPLDVQFSIDIALIVVSALLTIPLCWLPIYRRLPPGAELSTWLRASRLAREGLVIAIFGLALFAFYLEFAAGSLAGWRFGILSFLLGALIVLVVELIAAFADAASGLAESLAMRFSPTSASTQPPKLPLQPDADADADAEARP